MVPSESNFFGEIGSGGLSFFFQNNEDKKITGLSVFNFANRNGEYSQVNAVRDILDNEELLKDRFNKVFISYAFNESVLIPEHYHTADQNIDDLNLLYGDLYEGIVLTDHVRERRLYNTYRVPADIHRLLLNRFSAATFSHQYSLLIKQLPQVDNLLRVIFYQHKIVIILLKESKLQIIKNFKYITAEDVLYHMLNVCNLFDATEVNVELCGLIEKDSALYKEIQKYFLKISFPGLPGGLLFTEEIEKLPAHFFSELFAFASCV